MTLNEFLAQVKSMARPNKYVAVIHSPVGANRTVELFCQSFNIEPTKNNVETMLYYGKKIIIPGDTIFGQLTATFLLESEHQVRDFFIKWFEHALEKFSDSSFKQGNLDIILQGSIEIHQLNERNQKTKQYKFEGVVPVEVGGIQYNMENENQVLTLDVTFEYIKRSA